MKQQLRQAILAEMKSLPKTEKHQADSWLTEQLLQSAAYQRAQVIATYLPFPHEFDTHHLIKQAQADGKRIVVPKTYPHGKMLFTDYHPHKLKKTAFGLLEPISDQAVEKDEIDVIHVPGVAFDVEGYRIGYGGGYYDRYLADFSGCTISTIYKCQYRNFEHAEHDIPVKELVIYE